MIEVTRKDSLCIKTSSRFVFLVEVVELILVSGVATNVLGCGWLRLDGLDDSWTYRSTQESRSPRRPHRLGDAVLLMLLLVVKLQLWSSVTTNQEKKIPMPWQKDSSRREDTYVRHQATFRLGNKVILFSVHMKVSINPAILLLSRDSWSCQVLNLLRYEYTYSFIWLMYVLLYYYIHNYICLTISFGKRLQFKCMILHF